MTPREIKAALILKGITQTAIAKKLGVLTCTVGQVIAGRSKSARIAKQIAEELGLKVEDIWPEQVA